MRSLVTAALLVCWVLLPSPARAQEEADATTVMLDRADAAFAVPVGWMARALFFDLYFWDGELAPEQAIGRRRGSAEIVGHTDAGYQLREVQDVAAPVAWLEEPTPRKFGSLDGTLSTQPVAGSNEAVLRADIPEQPVDLVALGLAPALDPAAPPPDPAAEAPAPVGVVTVTTLAPFPVQVDIARGVALAATAAMPRESVPVRVGSLVAGSDGRPAEVRSLRADGSAEVLSLAVAVDPTPEPDPDAIALPIVVVWLVIGAVFFTLRMGFINFRGFYHAIQVTLGRYDRPEDHGHGEISHFQALSSALSATVGLGNIAGVAIAVSTGGPGAVFWMVVAGFLGMSSKFTECTLGQMYRVRRPDGSVSGGPMHYLEAGLGELGLAPVGKVLAVVFAVLCVGGSLGGGNMFQANQSFASIFSLMLDYDLMTEPQRGVASVGYGILLAVAVGVVILGGIQRIAKAAELIVPLMCGIYLLAGGIVLALHAADLPAALGSIVHDAFTPRAGMGGLLGVLVTGFRRAAFSNEAGIGSASIAHSAATTPYPVREGIVALLEPFIDTVVVCTMTGLVVVVTGTWDQTGKDGVLVTAEAFATVLPWFPVVLSFTVVLFAYSTMISWSYYGERCSTWLLGEWARVPYRVLFLFFVFFGSVFKLGSVLDFSDLMVLGMAFPNLVGLVLLSGKVKAALDDYWSKLQSGVLEVKR